MNELAELAAEATRRIVDEVHPLRIVLFGSAARGEMLPDSDMDLLVIVSNGTGCLETTYRIHRRLRGLGCAKDIVVVPENEMIASRDNPYLIVHTALTEGRELYHAA
jgi:uncharacterized protein